MNTDEGLHSFSQRGIAKYSLGEEGQDEGVILLGTKNPLTSGPLPLGRGSVNIVGCTLVWTLWGVCDENLRTIYVHTIKARMFIMDEILSIPTSNFRDAALEYPENIQPKLPCKWSE